ncbi:MAG TPA: hypothetical protein VGO90_02410 [Chthoniobacteraceae bacterium]|jgi:hypothetical protein|nr:hypothetical protein [Chthoniobacteraceae bacterium]
MMRPETLAYAIAGFGTLVALVVAVAQRLKEKQVRSGKRRLRD